MANFFDSTGKVFSISAHTLPSARGMGEPITGRISAESGVSFQGVIIGNDDQTFVIPIEGTNNPNRIPLL